MQQQGSKTCYILSSKYLVQRGRMEVRIHKNDSLPSLRKDDCQVRSSARFSVARFAACHQEGPKRMLA